MEDTKGKKAFIKKIRHKYRLAIFNEQSYEEVFRVRLSRLNVFTVISFSVVIIIGLVTLLIAYTGLKEYIPGYPSAKQRVLMVRNANRVDSLIIEIKKRDQFVKSIQTIIRGEVPESIEQEDSINADGDNIEAVKLDNTERDIQFRQEVEAEEKYNLAVLNDKSKDLQLNQQYFFPPIKGIVINKFNESTNHFGIDIVSKPGETVSATLDGTVIFTGWTVETGYVMIIQHASELISSYKHNSKLLKEVGSFVKAGEAIANTGNSGELTTGPHLHFELWYKSTALNPEAYILFE